MKNTVKVVVEMPKPIHGLITKLAAVEGSKPDEWYVERSRETSAPYSAIVTTLSTY